MKKLLPLIIALTLIQNVGFCQDDPSNVNNRFTKKSLFLFNAFEDGIAYFDDGGIAKAKCNYNVVNNEFCYIKNSNIFVISNTDELDSVQIGSKVFRYIDNKILETINSGKIFIFLNRKANVSSNTPSGAYGTESNTSAVSKKTSIYSHKSGEYVNIQDDNDLEISVSEKLYLLVNNELILATKTQINKKFKIHKSAIKSFMKENNINLNNKNDLLKLVSFLEKFI